MNQVARGLWRYVFQLVLGEELAQRSWSLENSGAPQPGISWAELLRVKYASEKQKEFLLVLGSKRFETLEKPSATSALYHVLEKLIEFQPLALVTGDFLGFAQENSLNFHETHIRWRQEASQPLQVVVPFSNPHRCLEDYSGSALLGQATSAIDRQQKMLFLMGDAVLFVGGSSAESLAEFGLGRVYDKHWGRGTEQSSLQGGVVICTPYHNGPQGSQTYAGLSYSSWVKSIIGEGRSTTAAPEACYQHVHMHEITPNCSEEELLEVMEKASDDLFRAFHQRSEDRQREAEIVLDAVDKALEAVWAVRDSSLQPLEDLRI